jgi:mono/diheme cytochrome c family protein
MSGKNRLKYLPLVGIFIALGLETFPRLAHTQNPADPPKVNYQKDIQPILEKNCYSCHGDAAQMSGLRLDSRQAILAGGTNGKIVTPGKAATSTLYQRIAGIGGLSRMPFGGQPLAANEIEKIRAWIDQGAEIPETATATYAAPEAAKKHWGFIAPVRPPVPQVDHEPWVRNPIDSFILARLEKEGLSPSPPADRVTLLRRLSLDLIGLPPTAAEVDAFVADKSPKAYEKQVERLLDSPHYGERWGRIWLDAARYADSNGYEKDQPRSVWFYRDWVINALNHDLPYNQFIIDQIAGDLLPHATQDQIVATGFLRNSMINEEGGIDPEQFRMEAMFDRMDAIGKGMLGITIQCAQCHNHKFDPLKQEEYYRMFAFINEANDSNIAVYTPQEQIKRQEVFRKTREIEAILQHQHPSWQTDMAKWEEQVQQGQPEWTVIRPTVDDISNGGQKYLTQPDGSFLCLGYNPPSSRVKMSVQTNLQSITAIRLELLTDQRLPLGGPGRSPQGIAALTEFTAEAAPADAPTKFTKLKFVKATADFQQSVMPLGSLFDEKPGTKRVTGPPEFAIDGNNDTAWGIDAGPGLRNQSRKAVFTLATPVSFPKGTILTIALGQSHGGKGGDANSNNLGRFRLSITNTPGATADPIPRDVREILAIPAAQRTPLQVQTEFGYWRTTVPEWKAENDQIAEIWKEYPEGTAQLVMATRDMPRETHILTRGDFLHPTTLVEPGVPAFLHPLPHDDSWKDGQPTRLTFARWLAARNSPTTARSIVNRVWQAYFGIGIVATSENFGTQGELPSHPELLDWLAVQFMDQGWSLKKLHRLIVTSATYQQSSRVTPELLEHDPYNRLLARGPRFRVDAEIVRDIALSASGLLNPEVGGPSVFPPAPDFLFLPPVSYSPKPWHQSTGAEVYRRALYTFRYRSVPYPMLETFDAPNGDMSCVRRVRSNTPLQALTTLNEPVFLEAARALAAHTLVDGGRTDDQRLDYAFRRCVARDPNKMEKDDLLAFLQKQTHRYQDGELNPWDLLGGNDALAPLLPRNVTPAQVAGWTAVSRVLLNLDETITKE